MATTNISLPQVVVTALIAGLIAATSWLFNAVIEVDRTQESVLARLESLEDRCGERTAQLRQFEVRLDGISTLIDTKAADRFTGSNAKELVERLELKFSIHDQQHDYIWMELNRLSEGQKKLHDAMFKP